MNFESLARTIMATAIAAAMFGLSACTSAAALDEPIVVPVVPIATSDGPRTIFGEGDLPSFIIADNPDVVIVTMGLNDNFTFHSQSDELRANITGDFDRLTTELPDVRLIVVEPFWYKDERPDSVDVIISWVHDAAAAVGADCIPDASYWLAGHPEWMASDGLHPNDDGYAAIATEMDQALRTLGL